MKKSSHEQIFDYFQSLVGNGKRFRFRSELARYLGLSTSNATTLFKFLDGGKTSYPIVLDWFDRLGGKIVLPDERNSAQDVQFIEPQIVPADSGTIPNTGDKYLAVPMVGEVGAGPGYLPEDEIRGYWIIDKFLPAVRYRRNLIAVQLGKHSDSMVPTLHPSDLVLVDRDDRNITAAGHIMLVLDPSDGSGKIKRVRVTDQNSGDFQIMYWSDNSLMYAPEIYSLKKDFDNNWDKCIVGRVIWAWTDVSNR